MRRPTSSISDLILVGLDAKGHETSPPARYTEASLVKRLEEEGIGRPSTYAPTVATIQRRGYVSRQGKALVPSFTAFAVTRLLREHFGDYVDIGFTAEMEEILDKISNGEKDWLDFIREFYRGDGKHTGLETLVEDKGQAIDYPMIEVGNDPESGHARSRPHRPLRSVPAAGRAGRRRAARVAAGRSRAGRPDARKGAHAAQGQGAGPEGRSARSRDRAAGLRDARPLRPLRAAGRDAGGAATRSRAARRSAATVTEETITLAEALRLLSLPRELGVGDDGEPIVANVGRFGPYVQARDRNSARSKPTDDVYTITLERAKELLAQPKKSMRRSAPAPKELRRSARIPTAASRCGSSTAATGPT